MIPNKIRESRRVKALKLPKNLERLYKEGKCRECAVVVTRMDFAKILGKFTKVKIQYESSTTPKTKQNSEITSPNSNARLKSNENGMVLIHRNAYSQHPVKELTTPRKTKAEPARLTPNVLKENNRLKKPILKDKNSNYDDKKKKNKTDLKQYGIVFEDPLVHNNNNEINSKITLTDILSQINDSILPAEDWCIDFFPKKGEPKDDKVYDRIAAELEDLMFSEKPAKSEEKADNIESKVDDFPSIMDILNDNSNENKTNDQSSTLEFKSNLESSDVEAMLLGKSNSTRESEQPTPMDVDNSDMSTLIEDVNHFAGIQDDIIPEQENNIPVTEMSATDVSIAEIPGTEIPGSEVPVIEIPGTEMPVSEIPITEIPDTEMPGTEMPVTEMPVTEMPVTEMPVTEMPVTEMPVTEIPATEMPVAEMSVTEMPVTEIPATEMPATEMPATEIPVTEMPEEIENPQSPSILDEALQKGIEEHLPCNTDKQMEELETGHDKTDDKLSTVNETVPTETEIKVVEDIKVTEPIIDSKGDDSKHVNVKETISFATMEGITHLVFKKTKDGASLKTVTCPKNLKYDIEIDGKSVEFIGAPKFISSLEDLQVLLQIVNESELDSLYVLH